MNQTVQSEPRLRLVLAENLLRDLSNVIQRIEARPANSSTQPATPSNATAPACAAPPPPSSSSTTSTPSPSSQPMDTSPPSTSPPPPQANTAQSDGPRPGPK
ncbi:classical arabinogalactan protein 9-like [Cynoglossus semilaevis]|uniref:classical arabinogalactan protein 9-like n=1 Tax=Cynoglossus semilaevis TaxID=244447 RepID=UPI0007DC91E5|nr:classical arabinogalactan protein 9-like [Cynoglossus semilaevis]